MEGNCYWWSVETGGGRSCPSLVVGGDWRYVVGGGWWWLQPHLLIYDIRWCRVGRWWIVVDGDGQWWLGLLLLVATGCRILIHT